MFYFDHLRLSLSWVSISEEEPLFAPVWLRPFNLRSVQDAIREAFFTSAMGYFRSRGLKPLGPDRTSAQGAGNGSRYFTPMGSPETL